MLPRWLWLNHVPAGLELTPVQYSEMRRRVRGMGPVQHRSARVGSRVGLRLAPAVAGLVITFIVWLLWLIYVRPQGVRYVFALVGGILLFQGLLWVAIAWSINRAIAPLVWRALNDIGFRVCIECGYILDYLPLDAPRCPECGQALHPPTDSAMADRAMREKPAVSR
jgi:hypothetical protein